MKDVPWHDCVLLLQLLSALNLNEISDNDLSELKGTLHRACQELWSKMRSARSNEARDEPGDIDHEISIDGWITELVKVSLLTERSRDGTLLLNNVTKACALLVPTNISSDDLDALESSAKEVRRQWNPNNLDPGVGHS